MNQPTEPAPPSRFPFTQGTGTVFQFVGVTLFLISMFICCCTSLIGKDSATHSGLTAVGWHRSGDTPAQPPFYSAQRALTITLPAGLVYGMALAAMGLGLQTESRSAPGFAITINVLAGIFWLVQLVFFASLVWVVMSIVCTVLGMLSALLTLLSIGARREMRAAKEFTHAK